MTDHTHAAAARSWVASANGQADFPIQNLPVGVFSPHGAAPRGVVGGAQHDAPGVERSARR